MVPIPIAIGTIGIGRRSVWMMLEI